MGVKNPYTPANAPYYDLPAGSEVDPEVQAQYDYARSLDLLEQRTGIRTVDADS